MVSYLIPSFLKTSAKRTTFVVKFSQKNRKFLEVKSVFGGRTKAFPCPYLGLISAPKKATDK